jgi:ferredoxin
MTFTVTLLPNQLSFDVRVNETILEGALRNNVAFPHRCQVGACAACLTKKIGGSVRYHLEPTLTENERQEGWVFACQAIPESDLVLTMEE